MKRIRAIIPDNKNGIFYNIEDLLPALHMEKKDWDKIFNSAKNFCEMADLDGYTVFLKIFNRHHYIDKINDSEGEQEHLYVHEYFFDFFLPEPFIYIVHRILNGKAFIPNEK
ncbi:hypothetical protein IJJ97_05900 [bacterium]|nr:hypothetical protein [bacterium]